MKSRFAFSLALGLACAGVCRASDHADTAANYNRPGADLSDPFIFTNPSNPNSVVLVLNCRPLIPAGQAANYSFDPNVLYQFKIDTNNDANTVEDLVIQVRFAGSGANQQVVVAGPYKPMTTGTSAVFARPYQTTGRINNTFSPTSGMTVFAGVRSDPFFFDLDRFLGILPDRKTPMTGKQVDYPSIMAADTPQINGFRGFPAGSGFDTSPSSDLLANFNVLSIVVELPRSALGGGVIRMWVTTSVLDSSSSFRFNQQDRLARAGVNEVLATVTANRHAINNLDNPGDDVNNLKNDILSFMNFPAGRSAAIANVLAAVLVPDVLVADLSQPGIASFLGVETGGFTGGKFGGRKLQDDIVDLDLGAIFGKTIPALGLAPDDGKELPQFSTDNVGPHSDYQSVFPYLGNPH